MTTNREYYCPNCGRKYSNPSFLKYKCPNCNTVVCAGCKKSTVCWVCKKANWVKASG